MPVPADANGGATVAEGHDVGTAPGTEIAMDTSTERKRDASQSQLAQSASETKRTRP